ncbi:6,7-dimethyl-8-ribityllumazine synthase [Curtobacterium sp. RHCKG23]|jgi:6,7-dimethyl-8-ribityllumazine synthase|uniref:6,7-dimethyl-8-ribityllumazine synthase n=1 Tax=Curtobacterium citri TaxID=3055139 RepID=A0ABT7T286_9MICO|nr:MULTISPECIES: 6,7-dimethyl-8-ribityllumazine synthase [Curtobacterium]MDM7883690.1 6,7-dimethyl-8-ribityllumazine synthase [Curtobacterium citri]OEI68491.1 6,7-dimethyl-8-ribityllumazine synthase [Curtobacterium sp. ER1/6]
MSGAGAAERDHVDGSGIRVAIVAGQWHETIAGGLLAGAQREVERLGATAQVVPVPGSFELPVVAKTALEAGFDAVVALGVIIRGGTPHFDYVSSAATSGLTTVALESGKPVGFGVLTLDDEQQGLDRAGLPGSKEDKGAEAAHAAIATAVVLRSLRQLA